LRVTFARSLRFEDAVEIMEYCVWKLHREGGETKLAEYVVLMTKTNWGVARESSPSRKLQAPLDVPMR
jgi:hypothetical protein